LEKVKTHSQEKVSLKLQRYSSCNQLSRDNDQIICSGENQEYLLISFCGRKVFSFRREGYIAKIQVNPRNRNKILALEIISGECKIQSECSASQRLILNEGASSSWRVVADKVVDFNWVVNERGNRSNSPKNRIIAMKENGDSSFVIVSDTFFNESRPIIVATNAMRLISTKKYIYILVDKKNNRASLKLVRRERKHISARAVWMSLNLKPSYLLRFSDSNNGRVFLHVVDPDIDYNSGVLLGSDSTGRRFYKYLQQSSRNVSGQAEMALVNGVYGVIFANQYISKENAKQINSSSDLRPKNRESLGEVAKLQINTLVSFDHGTTWNKIAPPVTFKY